MMTNITTNTFTPRKELEVENNIYHTYHATYAQPMPKDGISIGNIHNPNTAEHIQIDYYERPQIGLSRLNKSAIYIPTHDLFRDHKRQLALTMSSSCHARIRKFHDQDISETYLSDIQVGDFNSDDIIDIAYIYRPPHGNIHSTILYGHHLSTCSDEQETFVIHSIDHSTSLLLDHQHSISANRFYKLSQAIKHCGSHWKSCTNHFIALLKIAVAHTSRDKQNIYIDTLITLAIKSPNTILLLAKILSKWEKANIERSICKLMHTVHTNLTQPESSVDIFRILYRLPINCCASMNRILPALINIANALGPTDFFAFGFREFSDHPIESGLFADDLHEHNTDAIIETLMTLSHISQKKDLIQALPIPPHLDRQTIERYRTIIDHNSMSTSIMPRDIVQAEKTIGDDHAILLWKAFNITRFNRYHSSILSHLVELAKDSSAYQDKPLIISIVAKHDHSNIFEWGNTFEYDPSIRIIVMETHNQYHMSESLWHLKRMYGEVDSLMFTFHGAPGGVILDTDETITTMDDSHFMKNRFTHFFTGKGYILLNTCSGGLNFLKANRSIIKREKIKMTPFIKARLSQSIAEMFANSFHADIAASRNIEGLPFLSVSAKPNQRARLIPTFIEIGWPYLGINHGGSIFSPSDKANAGYNPYAGPADIYSGLHYYMDFKHAHHASIHTGISYKHAMTHHTGMGIDLGISKAFQTGQLSFQAMPRIFTGLTNHMLGFFSASLTHNIDNNQQSYSIYTGLDLLLPFIKGHIEYGIDPLEKSVYWGYGLRF